MEGRSWALVIIVALLSGGVTPFLVALIKRKPEVAQMDAQTTTISIQGAETTVALTVKALERAEERAERLEQKLAEREAKIDELEGRCDELARKFSLARDELDDMRRQFGDLRDKRDR